MVRVHLWIEIQHLKLFLADQSKYVLRLCQCSLGPIVIHGCHSAFLKWFARNKMIWPFLAFFENERK